MFGPLEYSFSVHYILEEKKITQNETDYPKTDVKLLKTRSTARTHYKQRFISKNQEFQKSIEIISTSKKYYFLYIEHYTLDFELVDTDTFQVDSNFFEGIVSLLVS